MARKGYGRNSTLVNTTTHADDGTSPVGSNEWNENPKKDGIFGLTKSAQTISGNNNIVVTDSYIEITTEDSASGGSNDGIYTLSAGTSVLTAANYPADTDGGGSGSSISEGDLIYVVKAASQGTTSLVHQQGGSGGAGKITTLTAGNKELSATVPTILMARTIGSVLEWVEYGGGAVADSSITTTKILNGTILNEDINASAGIELSKLASDPLARAGHTGSQAASTISDFDTEVANNTAVAANTAKTGITSGQAGEITANTAKISYSTTASNTVAANTTLLGATAGTVSASKALIVDASKDLTGINDLTIAGDLTVNGTTTTLDTTNLAITDKNIVIASGSTLDANSDGAGITIKGATDKTITWDDANDNLTSNQDWNVSTGKVFKINNDTVLNATSLGINVVSSSLTSIGTLASGVLTGATGTAAGLTAGNATLAAGLSAVLADNRMPDLTGEVTTSEGAVATVIVDDIIDEANLKVSNAPTDGYMLTAQSGNTGGLTWALAGGAASVDVDFSNTTTLAYRGSLVADSTHAVGNDIATRALGTARDMYIRKIDDNNEGVFTVIHKNGALVEVQIA